MKNHSGNEPDHVFNGGYSRDDEMTLKILRKMMIVMMVMVMVMVIDDD